MTLHEFLHGLKRLTVVISCLLFFWAVCFLAIVGAEHIVYDHMLFGLMK
jgi:hypothetical protein